MTTAREAVSEARQAWAAAMLAGDLPTLIGMYSDEVVVMPSDESAVIGKEAADAWYEAFHQSVDITAWSIPADDIEVSTTLRLSAATALERSCLRQLNLSPWTSNSSKFGASRADGN